jgi:hypothetical protein
MQWSEIRDVGKRGNFVAFRAEAMPAATGFGIGLKSAVGGILACVGEMGATEEVDWPCQSVFTSISTISFSPNNTILLTHSTEFVTVAWSAHCLAGRSGELAKAIAPTKAAPAIVRPNM